MVLSKDDNYFYVHRDVYDKAVVLSDRYEPEALLGALDATNNEETIDWLYSELPKPINILSTFLGLIQDGLEADLEKCCGALHAITSVIDVREFVKQPKELRKSIEFSLSILEEYEMSWERFFLSSISYDERNQVIPYMVAGQVIGGAPPRDYSQYNSYSAETEEYDDGPEKYGPGWTRVSEGIYKNEETNQTMYEDDDDDDDEDFLSGLFSSSSSDDEEVEEDIIPQSTSTSPTEKKRISELLREEA